MQTFHYMEEKYITLMRKNASDFIDKVIKLYINLHTFLLTLFAQNSQIALSSMSRYTFLQAKVPFQELYTYRQFWYVYHKRKRRKC